MVIINIECAMKQEFLNYWNPRILGIPVVAIVMSRTRSLRDPTHKILSTHAPYPYICVTRDSNSEEPSRVHYAK